MKKILILGVLLLHFCAFAQKKDFIGEYTYTAGDRDSKDVCFDIAKTHLRSILLDEVGVYVRNETTLRTTDLAGKFTQEFKENITALTASITEFHIIDQKWDGFKYWLKARVTIDTTSLSKLATDAKKSSEVDDLRKEIESIKKLLTNVKISTSDDGKLYTKMLLQSGRTDQFNSLIYSKVNKLLYVTTSNGYVYVFNSQDSLIKRMHFPQGGTLNLDESGEYGGYVSSKNKLYLFRQRSLKIIDSVQVASNLIAQGAMKVWFANGGIYISSFKNIYVYIEKKIILTEPNYTILDYNDKTNRFLLGKWSPGLFTDRKIKQLYIVEGLTDDKKNILNIDRSYEVSSYLMDNGTNVVSYDGKGNYYGFNTNTWTKNLIIQDTITDVTMKTFGLSKVNDNTILVVKHNPFKMTPENIKLYNVQPGDMPTEFIFKKSLTGNVVRSIILLHGIYKNQIIISDETKTIYYLTSGGNGNKLISIR